MQSVFLFQRLSALVRLWRSSSNFIVPLFLHHSVCFASSLAVQGRGKGTVRPAMSRRVIVVDPAWAPVDEAHYNTSWKQLQDEAMCCGFIGLDLEWTSGLKPAPEEVEEEKNNSDGAADAEGRGCKRRGGTVGPVAVVQLSTFSATFVIKLSDLARMVHDEDRKGVSEAATAAASSPLGVVMDNLRSLLGNKHVAKVGVGILGDQEKLQRDYAVLRLSPCVELAVLARQLFPASEEVMRLRSLKDLAARFAGTNLKKDILVTRSDWGSRLGPLSPLQVQYAAADAEASFDACLGMCGESTLVAGDNDDSDDVSETRSAVWTVKSILRTVAEVKAKTSRKAQLAKPAADCRRAALWCKGRTKPYYDNIFVYDAEMRLVFTVDKAKAEWYVHKKGIAKVIAWGNTSDEATPEPQKPIAAIQLNFTPNFSMHNDAHLQRNLDYFRQAKENQCVVCGNAQDLVRFAVVPLAYRKYFPSVYMSHNSYDLLLLCTACFAVTRRLYEEERQRVAVDFGVPLGHLTQRELQLRRAQLQQLMSTTTNGCCGSAGGCNGSSSSGSIAARDAEEFLLPAHKLRIMQAYLDIEEHREVLFNIFKYAKVLYLAHEERKGAKEERRAENGFVAVKQTSVKPSAIPPERLRQLSAYIRQHAERYPFARCAAEQVALFTADAASEASVRCILEEGVSPRVVLTRFWLREHPKVRELFGPMTRRGEHRDDASLPKPLEHGEKEEDNFAVDSHGFLVVQAVLQKYEEHDCKGRDHAVGEFIYRWRTAFLRGMQPRHLPSGWSAEDGILLV
ncbi:exonuclease 3-5 domain containing 2 [Trypanosoma rangeli]|uniref:3'-5' exonuclease n=1 Tax=Trypanosoma rangeli TaxID=5698 RepID=A0A422NPF9_TRYRA|nr:exonuclease 3-5 domain containing 2 [Trypanosoma rangeli]RNF07326.1 exonuclease 3-5 domain containing 2 [Trypanosoma rangeli]|eukprot:RNF07326.1 exonuclease 3-5 domain containing 2 [Trypanosoma rangeli]